MVASSTSAWSLPRQAVHSQPSPCKDHKRYAVATACSVSASLLADSSVPAWGSAPLAAPRRGSDDTLTWGTPGSRWGRVAPPPPRRPPPPPLPLAQGSSAHGAGPVPGRTASPCRHMILRTIEVCRQTSGLGSTIDYMKTAKCAGKPTGSRRPCLLRIAGPARPPCRGSP